MALKILWPSPAWWWPRTFECLSPAPVESTNKQHCDCSLMRKCNKNQASNYTYQLIFGKSINSHLGSLNSYLGTHSKPVAAGRGEPARGKGAVPRGPQFVFHLPANVAFGVASDLTQSAA
jgi:hypothetical protein